MHNRIKNTLSFTIALILTLFEGISFLFLFLLYLNIMDCITGIMKAKYLKIESSEKAFKGVGKKLILWCMIVIGFGISISLIRIGEYLNVNLKVMILIGWFVVVHCIINEIRSILENIVQMGKGHLIPPWLISGLEVTNNLVDGWANGIINKVEHKNKEKENEDNDTDK